MAHFDFGEVYWIEKSFDDDPEQSKLRPVIIVGKENDDLILVATTTQGPEDPPKPYDQFKFPILNWRKAGLTEPSWCLCLVLIELPKEALQKYIGKMDERDYEILLDFLETVHG